MLKPNSEKSNCFIGIDVSKATLDIYFADKFYKIANQLEAISTFIKEEISSHQIALCVLEATGGYEKLVMKELQRSGVPVHRGHPNRISHFSKSIQNAKTDKLDAYMLYSYAEFIYTRGNEKGDEVACEEEEKMKDIRRLIATIEKTKHAVQCRLKQFSDNCRVTLEEQILLFNEQLQALNAELTLLIKNNKESMRKVGLLTTLKGVAEKSAISLLAELPELGALTKREIASLVGVAPRTRQSGQKVMPARIYGGRFQARKVVYMCALVASRHDPILREYYLALLAKGKEKKQALVALMRKLIIYANAMIRKDEVYALAKVA